MVGTMTADPATGDVVPGLGCSALDARGGPRWRISAYVCPRSRSGIIPVLVRHAVVVVLAELAEIRRDLDALRRLALILFVGGDEV